MRNPFPLFDGNFRGGDLDLLINLNRVAVNYLAAQMQRDFNSQSALTGGCWTDDCDDTGNAGESPALLILVLAHARENIMRKRITAQSTARRMMAPMIWLREKRIRLVTQVKG